MRTPTVMLLALALAACGGGGSGGGDDDPGPPPPAFALTLNPGLAIRQNFPDIAILGTRLIVTVSELEMGADLNGDGDAMDDVVHVVDTSDDSVLNLGFAGVGQMLASDLHFAFQAREADDGIDYSGDGDLGDAVWFVYDPLLPAGASNPLNTGVATRPNGLAGIGTRGGFVFFREENNTGTDLNGDGDTADQIVALFDGGAFALTGAALLARQTNGRLVQRNGRVGLTISEVEATQDFNADGDTQDITLFYADFNGAGPVLNPVGVFSARAVANHPFALTDRVIAYFIDEATDAGLDLNGDGDAADAIIAIFDIAGGTQETRPTNGMIGGPGTAGHPAVGIGAGPERIVFAIDENSQNQTDLNGDMDPFDPILAWVNARTAPGVLHFQPFTLAPRTPRLDGPQALVLVNERSMGLLQGVDINGDGDDNDDIAFRLDMTSAPGTLTNLNLATSTVTLRGNDVLLGVSEASNGAQDRNGDGDAADTVLAYVDLGHTSATPLGLGVIATAEVLVRVAADEVRIGVRADEGQSPLLDNFNNDGDTDDRAVLLLGVDPSFMPPRRRTPTTFFAGTSSFFVHGPVLAGDAVFVFASLEDMANTDLNGDGDLTDTVLRYVRILPPPP